MNKKDDKMNCKQCGVDKELNTDNFYKSNTRFGYDKTCIVCRTANQKNRTKLDKSKIKYRKCKDLIQPTHPIPVKLTSQDGFGGYYRYDANRLCEPLINSFIRQHGILHRNKRYSILQVKSQNKQQMLDFAQCINMSSHGVTYIQREQGKECLETYVINLIGKNIRMTIR